MREPALPPGVPLVDAHAHLADPSFDGDRPEVLARARAAGVARIVTVGETPGDARRILALAREHREIAPAIGLYPTVLDRGALAEIAALARDHRDELVALGEVGLDRWKVREPADRELQLELFLAQVDLARELDLPLNVHSRSAGRHAIEALAGRGARRVLLHAFDARPATVRRGLEAGFFFSIPPSIVRSPQKRKLAAVVPLDRLLLETDSPVLGPDRDRRNEPANLLVVLDELAALRGIPREEIARATTANARRLFGPGILPPEATDR